MKHIKVLSFAKINLSIDVGNVGEDGYHPVDMVMQQLSFHDDVHVSFEQKSKAESHTVRLTTNRYYLPTDSRNLAYRAAELMAENFGRKIPYGDIVIDIKKRIPVAAGLAGGSGNAAAVLHALNVLWELNLSLRELCHFGDQLGSDVAFCIVGQGKCNYVLPKSIRKDALATSCVRATGRGTSLEPIVGMRKPIVFAKPKISVSTREVYENIDCCTVPARPNNDELCAALKRNDSMAAYDNFINVLENYTLKVYPEVGQLKATMERTEAEKVLMSGSGPTVFAIYSNIEHAKKICRMLRGKGYETYWTRMTK